MGEVYYAPVEMIGEQRAARAALLPSRPEHKVVHDQLALTAKEAGQGFLSAGAVEDVFLLHLDPGKLAAFCTERVPLACEVLLLGQQILAGLDPLSSRYDRMLCLIFCHDRFSLTWFSLREKASSRRVRPDRPSRSRRQRSAPHSPCI